MKHKTKGFLVYRQQDGNFYTNCGYAARRAGKPAWSKNPADCKPFKTMGGAKAAVVGYCFKIVSDSPRVYDRVPFSNRFALREVTITTDTNCEA